MKNTTGIIRRICAGGLAALVMFTSVPTEQLVLASEDNKGIYSVHEIEAVSGIEVTYGTSIEDIGLPETLQITLIDTTAVSYNDSTEASTESEIDSSSEVTLEAKNVEEVEDNEDGEPEQLMVEELSLDNTSDSNSDDEAEKPSITADIPVEFNCDNYDSKTPGSYTFAASFKSNTYENYTLMLAADVTMPEVTVTVLEKKELILTQDMDGITITLKADEGVFPADAVLFVEKIEEAEKVEKIEQSINDTIAQTAEENETAEEPKTVEKAYSYDIKVLDVDGNELQPDNEKGDATVSFTNVEIPTEEGEKKSIEVYHVDDKLEIAEAITTEVKTEEKTVEITPEHFSIYIVTIVSGTAQLRYYKGATSAEQYYMISTAADLQVFSDIATNRTSGNVLVYTETGTTSTINSTALNKNAKLMNDITGVTNWMPIGNSTYPYTATFDGDGHSITISSISSLTSTFRGVGIVGSLGNGIIKNLTVKGTIVTSGIAYIAGIAGYASGGTISNCRNLANITGNSFVGGIVGYRNEGTLTNCENTGTITGITAGDTYVGGICGRNGAGTIDKCTNTGTVTSTTNTNCIGGIVGSIYAGVVQNCYNGGTVTGVSTGYKMGGIAGENINKAGVIQNCYNWGNISGYASVGGIVGRSSGTVQGVYNIGSISGRTTNDGFIGGIAGYMPQGTIYYAHNRGNVSSSGQCTGGIVGGNWSEVQGPISLKMSFNEGSVGGAARASDSAFIVGGIAGIFAYSATNTLTMGWCYNKGMLQGSYYDHWSTYGTSPNLVGNCLGSGGSADGNSISFPGGSFGNTVLYNMTEFYNDTGASRGLMSWTGDTANPSLSGSYSTTPVISTEVRDRPYYTYEDSTVRVYANGYPIVISETGANTGVYLDVNKSGTYDTGDTAVKKKDGSGSCLYASGSTIYIYGGGEGVDITNRSASIYMKSGNVSAIFGGGNGASVVGATINIESGTIGNIYASALNYNMSGNSSIYIRGGTITGSIKGKYNDSSTVGNCSVTLSGAPTISGGVDLSTFTDKYAKIGGVLTGSAGSIKLTNPSSTVDGTNVAYSSSSNYISAEKFSLSSYRLRSSGNYVKIKKYFDETVNIKLNGTSADVASIYSGAEGLYIKSNSATTYQQITKSALGQYKVTNLATGTSYNLYYKKGASYIQIPDVTCSETNTLNTLDFVSVKNELNSIVNVGDDIATRKSFQYSITLQPMTRYPLPDTLNVVCNETVLTANMDYNYNNQTGALSINAGKVTGTIKITTDSVTPYFEQNNGSYSVYGSGYYLKIDANGDNTKVTWCETANGTYKTLYHKTDSTQNADELTGQITVFGGNNGTDLNGDTHITMTGGTIEKIYGGSNGGSVINTDIIISGGTVGYVYGGSLSSGTATGNSSVSIFGRPIISRYIDLSTFTDHKVNITGEINSKSGAIILKNPSSETIGTVVASATIASYTVAKKFVLLNTDGNPLTVAKVRTDVVIIEAGTLNCVLNASSTNVTADSIHFGEKKATYATSWTGTLLPTDGYKLPNEITVKSGNTALTRTTELIDGDYTYNKVTGEIVIESESVLGNIDVTAIGTAISYTIYYNGNGGTVTGTDSVTVNYGENITFPTVTPPADRWTLVGWSQTYNAVENSNETEVAKKIYKTSTTDSFSKVDGTTVTLYAIWKTTSENTSLLNGSFEYPSRSSWTNKVMYTDYPQMYWMTTASDKKIELGRPSVNVSCSWSAYHVREASDGEQFAELNANSVAALYQIVETVPGMTFHWGLDHKARSTTASETMELWIGNPTDISAAINAYKKAGNTVDADCESILNRTGILRETITDNCNAWYTHTGDYTVPAGQTQTTFAFVSQSNPASNSMGNLLDNVYFTMQAPKAKKDITVRTGNGGTATVTVDATTSTINGSNGSESNDFRKTVEYDSILKITPLAKEGYTYNGAMINGVYKSKAELENDYNSLLFTIDADTPTEIVLLYAKDSTVSLVANGGVLGSGEQLLVADVSLSNNKIDLSENQPTRNGYLLSGWLVAGTGTVIGTTGTVTYTIDDTTDETTLKATDGTNTVSIVTEDGMMLIAQWAVDDATLTKTVLRIDANEGVFGEYAINYDGSPMVNEDGKRVIVPLQTDYTIDASYMGDGALVLRTPIRTGYKFLGWKDETTGFTTEDNGVAADSTVIYSIDGSTAKLTVKESDTVFVTKDAPESLTLTAQWEKMTYVLTVPSGSGYQVTDTEESGLGDFQQVTYGEDYSFKVVTDAGYNAESMTISYKIPYENKHTITKDENGIYTIPGANITGAIEIIVSGLTDDIAPTGEIKVGTDNSNIWNSFLNTITFGIFFKKTQNVTITAADTDGSGVEKIQYYVSDKELINETGSTAEGDIKNPDISWSTYDNGFSINPNKKVIIYVKITDNATNVTYISSDGIILDSVAPAISGVVNGGTYTGSTEITVMDDYLADDGIVVTNDGQGVEVTLDQDGKFTLIPVEQPYSITITDQSGNETAITFNIGWNMVTVPEITSKPYTGSNQTSDIISNTTYMVTNNAGGTNIGTYDVVLTLTDTINTEWKAVSGSDTYVVDKAAGTVTCKFAITKADNSFIQELSCEGFTYTGATAASASATSTFGTPKYIYYTDEECANKTTTATGASAEGGAPKNAGTYYVKATVTGTDNYNELTSSAVSFTISPAFQDKPVVSATNETYENQGNSVISGVTSKMEYATDLIGTWTKVTDEQNTAGKIENLAVGTYYVRYAADDNHTAGAYETITIEAGSKIEVSFTADGCNDEELLSQIVEVAYNGSISRATTPAMPTVPDKTGYDAKGWKLSGTEDSQLVTSITGIHGPATYVAVYAPKTLTITLSDKYNAGGTETIYEKYQTGFYKDQECTNQMTDAANAITTPSKIGYTFNGYYTESEGKGTKVIGADGYYTTGIDTNFYTGDSTIYAYWTENSYNINVTIAGDGVGKVTVAGVGTANELTGTITYTKMNTITVTPDAGYTITDIYIYVNGIEKQHYTSNQTLSFSLSDGGYGVGDVDISINTTLVFHSITFRDTKDSSNTLDYTILGNTPDKFAEVNGITLPQAEKTGYDFQGWKISGTNTLITAIPEETTENVVLVPVFSNKIYEINYETNGGTLTGSYPQTYVYGIEIALPTATSDSSSGTISRIGYIFEGWYITEGYSGDAITAVSASETGNKTFYAKWKKITYTVTLPTSTTGYTVSPAANAASPVDYDGSYSFIVNLAAGYSKTADFKVIANKGTDTETVLNSTTDGGNTYAMNNILENKSITVEGIGDITAPTVNITVKTNNWTQFLNNITFGIFFKETQKVTITAADAGSGVKTIYYYTSDHELTLDEVKALLDSTDWKIGSSFNIEPNQEVIIYTKVIDQANNITYASSQGIVLDNVAPAISGITNGATYENTQYFTVSDSNLKDTETVTIDGVAATAETTGSHAGYYQLVPKDSGSYTIAVTDKAGNTTTYTVTVVREEVTVPVIAEKTYNGQTQTADIAVSELYEVTTNAGGVDVNSTGYDSALTLKDSINYKWKTDSSRTDYTINQTAGTAFIKFKITKANNALTTTLTCEGFSYSGNAAQASAVAAFGSPVYTYYTNAGCTNKTSTEDGAAVAGGAPKNAGTYYVKATIAGTGNYTALDSNPVSFVIGQVDQETPTVGHTDVSYTGQTDGIISDIKTGMEWTTTPMEDSSWTKVTTDQITDGEITGLGVGTYYIRMEADRNHNISAVATVVIDSKIKIPVKIFIEPPVYDKDHLDKVTVKGTVTKGEYDVIAESFSYRKEGDSSWTTIYTIGSDVTLTGLSSDTIYELKLTATDSHGNVATDIQKFRTLQSSVEIGKITGSVDGDDSKKFSVSIKTGSTTVGTLTGLSKGDTFTFNNLADGEYNLEVTDGEFKVTIMVTVKNDFTENLGIVKVTEKQTEVEVQKEAPDVAVGGLSDVFDTSLVKDNSDAQDVLDNSGTIEIRLTASETTTPTSITKLTSKADADGKVIGMMTDLNVDMIIISLSGDTTTSSITDTEKLILIAIPLAEGAKGKTGYQAYRVHDGETQTLAELGSSERVNPAKEGFYVDGDYLYVVARYFSSYALTYDKETDPSNPVDLSKSVEPSKPVEPSKLGDTSDPNKPTDTSDSTDDSNPTDDNKSTDTSDSSSIEDITDEEDTGKNEDSTDVTKPDDFSNNTESQTDSEVNDSNKDDAQDGADSPIKNECNWQWYMLLLMAGFVLFVMVGKNKSIKLTTAVFVADVILTIILIVLGSCGMDIPFAVGTLVVAGASVPIKRMISKNQGRG